MLTVHLCRIMIQRHKHSSPDKTPRARVLLTDLSHITITMATGRAAMATASSLSFLQMDARVLAARVTIRGEQAGVSDLFQGQPSPPLPPPCPSPRLPVPYVSSLPPAQASQPRCLPLEVNNTLRRCLAASISSSVTSSTSPTSQGTRQMSVPAVSLTQTNPSCLVYVTPYVNKPIKIPLVHYYTVMQSGPQSV